jgi:hypothetical protein
VDDYVTLAGYGSRAVGGGNPSFTETLVNCGATFVAADGLVL